MAFENGYASGQLRGEINVTPMIDVLLVLLIIFMVIAPVMPHGLQAALPQRSVSLHPATPLVVQIKSAHDGKLTYKIDQDEVSMADLGTRLGSIFAARADRVMFVKADEHLNFSAIATVMDIGRSAGADRIGLLTAKEPL